MRVAKLASLALVLLVAASLAPASEPRWEESLPQALEAAGAKGLVVVELTPSRDDLSLLEAERLLHEHPQWDAIAKPFRWVRMLGYVEEAKRFGSDYQPTWIVVRPAPSERGFDEVGRLRWFDEPDSTVLRWLRDASKRREPETIDASRDGLRSRLAGEYEAARKSGDDTMRRAFVAANPSSTYAAAITRDLDRDAWPAPPQRAVADVVRLVPDLPTFLAEIGEWDERVFYPILLDGDHRNADFVEAFHPAAVERVPAARSGQVDEATIRAAFLAALTSLSLDKARVSRAEPEGLAADLVLTQADAPEWPGALALAAGHRERLETIDPMGDRGGVVGLEAMVRLRSAVRERLRGARTITLTLAGRFPLGYRDPTQAERGDYAIDDAVARDDRDVPLAFVGRLVGDPAQSIYQAMSSLFLRPKSGLFFSRYDTTSPPWSSYDPTPLAARLAPLFPTHVVAGESATLAEWRRRVGPRRTQSFVWVNSSGGSRDWSLAGPEAGDEMDVSSGPPAIVTYVHSGSAGNPYDVDTIAGRWLWAGAFVYFGSYREPFLDAFRTPRDVIDRALGGMPLGRALRSEIPEGRWRPWKLVYVGDPRYRLAAAPEPVRVKPSSTRGRSVTLDAPDPLTSLASLRAAAESMRRSRVPSEDGERDLIERAKPLIASLVEKGDRRGALEAYRVLLRGELPRRVAETLLQRAAALADAKALDRNAIRDALRSDAKGRSPLLALIDFVLPPK